MSPVYTFSKLSNKVLTLWGLKIVALLNEVVLGVDDGRKLFYVFS
jgi:hypothetical protein